MTPRQKEAYDFIRAYQAEKGYAPSHEDIRRAMGLRSKSGAHRLITGLAAAGHLTFRPYFNRSIVLREGPEYRQGYADGYAAGSRADDGQPQPAQAPAG